jgi:protein phosphatase
MVEAFGLSHQGLVRLNNEDRFAGEAAAGWCALADGMGGAQAGEIASALAIQAFTAIVASAPPSELLLREAFLGADRRVREAADANPKLQGMGTTLVAALETPSGLAIGNIGDSRAYLFDGELRQLTSDQTWANEIGRILGLDEAALRPHPLRHALTAAVGAGVAERFQNCMVAPRRGDLVLLSSDGLHGVVEAEQIAALLADGGSLEEICNRLIALTLERGAPDNVTVVLARF